MPTPPKKPNLPFLDDDEQTQLETPHQHDSADDTHETAPVRVDHPPGLNDEDDEATVAVPPIKVTDPAIPRPGRPRR